MRQGVFPSWGKLRVGRDAVPRDRAEGVVGWCRQDTWNELRKTQCSPLDHDMGKNILFCSRLGKMSGRSRHRMKKIANSPCRNIFSKNLKNVEKNGLSRALIYRGVQFQMNWR